MCLRIFILWSAVFALSNTTSCDIPLISDGKAVSVPEFCLSGEAARVLRFTLAENGSLTLNPLSPPRKANVELQNNNYGLKNWAKLANTFVDSVWSGSLPYDLILSAINSSVDSPIATANCMSDQRRTGSGNFELSDLLNDFEQWWTDALIVTALGPFFAVLLIIYGCCLCFCRCCGLCKCCGCVKSERDNKRLALLFIALFCCIQVSLVGISFSFVFNDQVNESVQNFDNTVNTALNSSLDFVDDVQMQANATVDRFEDINTFLKCLVDNSHVTIGRVVLDVFEGLVGPLINRSFEVALDHNNSINSLQLVNVTVLKLRNLTQRLQTELDGLTVMFQTLNANCQNTSLGSNCDSIPIRSYSVMNFTEVDDVTVVLNQLMLIGDITEQVTNANATFYDIPCDIRNQIQDQAQEVLDKADGFRDTIKGIANDIGRALNDILNEERFIGDIRRQSHELQEMFDQYDNLHYTFSIVICSLALFMIMALFVELLLGAFGFRCKTEQSVRRRKKLNCCVIYISIPLVLIFAVILLFLASITFFLGANMLKVCYSIAEDPPNNNFQSYELYSKIVDNSDLWGGYLLGCFLLDDSSIPLTVADILNGCKSNQSLYQVVQLRLRPNLNLRDMVNVTHQIPDLDQLFADLEESIEFNADHILTQETRDSLTSFASAGLQSFNYAIYSTYLDQITSQISTLAFASTISRLEAVHNGFAGFSHTGLANDTQDVISEITRIIQTTLAEIANCTELLQQQIRKLDETASLLNGTVQGVLDDANAIFTQLNGSTGSQIVINQTKRVLHYFTNYATDFANWAVNNLENEIGRCRPLYATYTNLYYEVCENAVDGLNGLWFSIGFCVLFLIPTLMCAVCMSHYLHVTHGVAPGIDAWMPPAVTPQHWDLQPTGADGKIKICHLVTLFKGSEEYDRAIKKFQETLAPGICDIVDVKRIQTPHLFHQYQTMKEDMKGTLPDSCVLERELFHGTRKETCDKINHQGFNKIYTGTNAAVYGKGVYFAAHAGYSSQEIYTPEDENGHKYIYSCLVLTGEYTEGAESMTVPPAKNEQNPAVLYDSLVDNENNPEIFVAVTDRQAYPQYLITFKMIH